MFEPPSHEAIRSGFQSASARLDGGHEVARGRRQRGAGAARAGQLGSSQRGGASWSSATSHVEPGQHLANSSRSERLTCTWVASRSSVRSRRERQVSSVGIGREVPSVEEVPGESPDYDAPVIRHFLTGEELTSDELRSLLDRALELKRDRLASRALEGRSVALLFERPSTRTRVSFEVGVRELGGQPLVLTRRRAPAPPAASRRATRRSCSRATCT